MRLYGTPIRGDSRLTLSADSTESVPVQLPSLSSRISSGVQDHPASFCLHGRADSMPGERYRWLDSMRRSHAVDTKDVIRSGLRRDEAMEVPRDVSPHYLSQLDSPRYEGRRRSTHKFDTPISLAQPSSFAFTKAFQLFARPTSPPHGA